VAQGGVDDEKILVTGDLTSGDTTGRRRHKLGYPNLIDGSKDANRSIKVFRTQKLPDPKKYRRHHTIQTKEKKQTNRTTQEKKKKRTFERGSSEGMKGYPRIRESGSPIDTEVSARKKM